MLKPSVGLTELMSSPLMRFMIVVFPALSSPLHRGSHRRQRQAPSAAVVVRRFWRQGTHTRSSRISLSLRLTFLMIDSSPMVSLDSGERK